MKVLALTRYGRLGASSRLRTLQYLPALQQLGINVDAHPLFDDASLVSRYSNGRHGYCQILSAYARRLADLMSCTKYDLLWIEKESLPFWPIWFEAALLRNLPYVLDYDDAIFHRYDQHPVKIIRYAFGRRIDMLMSKARLVVCGNKYLAKRAIASGAPRVEILPTVVDLDHYPLESRHQSQNQTLKPQIAWIGSPSTVKYLKILNEPLRLLARRMHFKLCVIGAQITLPGIDSCCKAWDEKTEVPLLSRCNIGIMPLFNTQWELGKCGYKIIQYMACKLPVVASPVGANNSIVVHGSNGYLAADSASWLTSIERLLGNPDLCEAMGRQGRADVENYYCLQVTAAKLAEWLYCAAFNADKKR